MSKVAIIGAGLTTSGGVTINDTWKFILEGRSSLQQLPEKFKGHVASKQAHVISDVIVGSGRLVTIAIRAINEVMSQQRGPTFIDGIFVGSTSASFSEVEGGLEAEPRDLVKELANFYRIPFKTQISQACSSSSHAIGLAADMIMCGMANVVLAGGADEVTSCVMSAFEACKIHAAKCTPYDMDRQGMVLGEAAAFILMARKGIGKPICYLSGVGLSCDAVDSVAPSEVGIARAIEEAILDSGHRQIDFIITHGTGTKLNDYTEVEAIKRAFNKLRMHVPFISSYKGSLGHPQGASGAVGVVLGIKAIQEQTLFPTVGLIEIDREIRNVSIVMKPLKRRIENVLCLSFGSWGTNAALVLTEAEDDCYRKK